MVTTKHAIEPFPMNAYDTSKSSLAVHCMRTFLEHMRYAATRNSRNDGWLLKMWSHTRSHSSLVRTSENSVSIIGQQYIWKSEAIVRNFHLVARMLRECRENVDRQHQPEIWHLLEQDVVTDSYRDGQGDFRPCSVGWLEDWGKTRTNFDTSSLDKDKQNDFQISSISNMTPTFLPNTVSYPRQLPPLQNISTGCSGTV